jgi:hypothetical protein
VTFKDLKKIIAEKSKEMERESKLYNPSYYWNGKEIVSLDQWLLIDRSYGLKAALRYFPNDFPSYGFPYVNNIEDQTLKQEAEQWYKATKIHQKSRIWKDRMLSLSSKSI